MMSPPFYYDLEVKTFYRISYDGVPLVTYLILRQKKYSRKFMMAYAVPINPVQS